MVQGQQYGKCFHVMTLPSVLRSVTLDQDSIHMADVEDTHILTKKLSKIWSKKHYEWDMIIGFYNG